MKKCPYCAEEIQDEAIKCRYCGEMLKKEEKKVKAKECSICGYLNESNAIYCVNPRCRNKIPINSKIIDVDVNRTTQSSNIPKCPTCGSTEVEKISVGDIAKTMFLWGSLKNFTCTFKCRKCGYKW